MTIRIRYYEVSRYVTGFIVTFIVAALWLAGIVLAKGFVPTIISICIPFYAWYLVIERLMIMAGIA